MLGASAPLTYVCFMITFKELSSRMDLSCSWIVCFLLLFMNKDDLVVDIDLNKR